MVRRNLCTDGRSPGLCPIRIWSGSCVWKRSAPPWTRLPGLEVDEQYRHGGFMPVRDWIAASAMACGPRRSAVSGWTWHFRSGYPYWRSEQRRPARRASAARLP